MAGPLSHAPDRSIVIAAGLRAPQAKAGGQYAKETSPHLGAAVARELLLRTGVDPSEIDAVICGCVGQPFDAANVGRVIALRAGIGRDVPAHTTARNCASGMQAVTEAITQISAGVADLHLCVGVEVMSSYPLIMGEKLTQMFASIFQSKTLGGRLAAIAKFRPSFLAPVVAITEGLTDPTCDYIMGKTAEQIARDFGISREESDEYACQSHVRARDARERGRFDRELMPHMPLGAREGARSLTADDGIRDQQTVEALAKMRPYFEKPDGIVTIGNSCGITDGATALLICTEEKAEELGLTPLARVLSYSWAGCDPRRMGLGPVFASAAALKEADCRLSDVGVVELNEAFASQVLACERAFSSKEFAKEHLGVGRAVGTLDLDRTNKNGGAIAIGHPVGATGARLLLTAAHELEESDEELALATLCIGGGQGGAVVLERMST